jgi:hypothetical protein
LITFDNDFGELSFRKKLKCSNGIIFLKFVPVSPIEPATIISALLNRGVEIIGMFVVLERNAVRKRKI